MTINRTNLAPCPFCGGSVRFHSDEDCPGCHYIECGCCKAMFDFSPTADPENQCDSLHELQRGIAHVWNTRAQAAPEAEPVAWKMFDGEGGYDYTDDEETAEEWRKYLGEKYKSWLEPLYPAPPHDADHSGDANKMVDAELVELLRQCRDDFAGVSMSHDLIERIDAKLATLRHV